jgi:diguanylate cyclase (GGDEF)-like protein/PAS domain S-box-containing protein
MDFKAASKFSLSAATQYKTAFTYIAKIFFIGVAYFAFAKLGLSIPYIGSHITLIWIPTGIAVAALLLWGGHYWPGIFLGAFATNYSLGSEPLLAGLISIGNTLGPLLSNYLLRRLKFNGALDRSRDILLLVMAAASGMLLSASGGLGSLLAFNVVQPHDALIGWLSWWAGDFVGVLLVLPLLLNISRLKLKELSIQRIEFIIWTVIMLLMSLIVFVFNNSLSSQPLPLIFTLLPVIVWSAMRFGVMGSSLGLLLPALIAAIATSRGLGPLYIESVAQGSFLLLLFIAIMVILNLMVTALQAGRTEAENAMRIAAVTFDTQDGIIITDPQGQILRVNQAFQEITGYSEEDVLGKNPSILQSGKHDPVFYQTMWSSLINTDKWVGEIWDKRKNGEIFPKTTTITAVRDSNHVLTHYVAVFRDISKLKQSEDEIRQLAFYDPLTGLPNRRLLMDRLNQAQTNSGRNAKYAALLFLDLDHFKIINDTQGHGVGDQLLIEVGHRLQKCVREGDTIARLGGDEFVVVLESLSSNADVAATQTELVAEKIRHELSNLFVLNQIEFQSTASIGIILFQGIHERTEDLLQHADVAMYQAKSAGRNTIRFFDPKMQSALDMRAKMDNDLRNAYAQKQFQLYYQVQVDNMRRPIGAETLLRWVHPERGIISPGEFIPLAEESGLIVPLGFWVLKTACAQLKLWQQSSQTRDLTLAVNVSAKQFRQADFVKQVQRVLLESGAKPSRLKLELTESTVLDNVEDTISKMREIKTLGVSFSMDDFGTGYSSLQYLKRLPLDQIKIDQSFVRDIATDLNDAAIVQTIIAMTEALGLDVIAEGVETEAQFEFIDLRGCHSFQGYLFGKPMPIEQFENLLQEQ